MGVINTFLAWMMLLFLPGVVCSNWKVKYHQRLICAEKGSTVTIQCSFNHPDDQKVKNISWVHVKSGKIKGKIVFHSDSRKDFGGIQYIGDSQNNCSLKIHQVDHHNAGKYTVRFDQINRQQRGVVPTLQVVDLVISIKNWKEKEAIQEGDTVTLTCIDGCKAGISSSVFTWFKNGVSVGEGPSFHLKNVSPRDSGNYTCSLKAHTGTTSQVLLVDVEYGPKNTSILFNPSNPSTLTCSSLSHPPVENYTWFKVVSGRFVKVGHQPQFLPVDDGEDSLFLCSVTNKHGSQNSSLLSFDFKQHRGTALRNTVLIIGAVAAFLTLMTITAVRMYCKKRMRSPPTICDDDIQDTDYVNWFTNDNNQPPDGLQCEGVMDEVVYTTVYFHNSLQHDTEL